MTETQERFLRTVMTRVPLGAVVEMHLFPPIRRGTMETGMAVIATVLPPAPLTVYEEVADLGMDLGEPALIEDTPVHAPRLRILTAAYRHTIKGIDRGKWTVDVQEEADAPLAAVEAVLRGVRQRSTEAADPELVNLETLAALIEPVRVAPAA